MFTIPTATTLRELSLKDRFQLTLMQTKAKWIFYDTIIDISVTEDNIKRIDIYQSKRDAAFETWYALKTIYESEYGDMTKEETKMLETLATKYAEKGLKQYGWK